MTQQEFQTRYKYNPSIDCIGEGGFGKVYKAYDTHLDRCVAIKVAEVKPGQEQVRLKKEVEMVSKLPTHPNIANYEACYTFSSFTGEYDFAVLQYYEEGNLQQLIDSGKLNQTQKETLLRQILEGVGFLHNQDIIHRDLKPHNILIAKRDGEYIPKITDFGISKKLDFNNSSVFTNSLAGAGTMAYASPEQLLGKTIKKNTDLWSFGVIAFQLLTGKLPFNSGKETVTSEAGRQELYKQITSGVITDNLSSISETWKNIILSCLVVDNNLRVQQLLESTELHINEQKLIPNKTIYIAEDKDVTNLLSDRTTKPLAKNNKLKIILISILSLIILFLIPLFINKTTKPKELKFKDGLHIVLNKDTVVDIDGNIYHTVTIGNQTWMMENLKTTRFRNGDKIESPDRVIIDNNNNSKYIDGKPTYQWVKKNNVNNLNLGRMYTWFVVIDSRNISPRGWRVPNSKDWQILIDYLSSKGCISKDMYANYIGTTLLTKNKNDLIEIVNKNDSVSISSCFSAVVGGWHEYEMYNPDGSWPFSIRGLKYVDDCAYWWTSDDNPKCVRLKEIPYYSLENIKNNMDKYAILYLNESMSVYHIALPIRCIKE